MVVCRTLTYQIRRLCSGISASSTSFSLKNVTRSNFDSVLPELTRHIQAADFVAIDLEMTGVTSAPWRESFEFDRPDVRYLKVKDSAEKFAVVQFGVCPFRWDPVGQSFIAHPHNFYIFPRQELSGGDAPYEFLCQTTSIDFLAKYQFDFNACILQGVSYLSRGQEEKVLSFLSSAYEEGLNVSCKEDMPLENVSDILFTTRMNIRLKEWRDKLIENRGGAAQSGSFPNSKQRFETIFFKLRPALRLDGFTSNQVRLIQMVTRIHFKDLVFVRTYGDDSKLEKLIVYAESESDKKKLLSELNGDRRRETEKKVKKAVGFRRVIDLLASENKLIVGHNCFLDFAHIYNKFLGSLPPTAEDFVSLLHKTFPYIVDTKILVNSSIKLQQLMRKSSTSLSSAFTLLCPDISFGRGSRVSAQPCVKVEVHVDDMRSSCWNSGAKHEAGYDAFMTGCVFAQSCSHLGINYKEEEEENSTTTNLALNDKLQQYMNLLYLSWNSGDIINLQAGDMVIPSPSSSTSKRRFFNIQYPHIVVIWGFDTKLKANEIRECICKVFGERSVLSTYHLDQTSVFVQFSKEESVSDFLALIERLESNNDAISVLHPLSKLLEGGRTRVSGYETYKEICKSPISKVRFAEQAKAVGFEENSGLFEGGRGNDEDVEENEQFEETVRQSLLRK